MITKKFNFRIYLLMLIFGGVIPLAGYDVYLLSTGQIKGEDGAVLSPTVSVIMSVLMIIILLSYLLSFVSILIQVIRFRNEAFTADETGVHNTIIVYNFLAFFFALPVEFIPWSAVSSISEAGGILNISVNTSEIKSSFIGKRIIKSDGYNFCHYYTADKLSQDERDLITAYCTVNSESLRYKN